jgi:DNA polymerase III gamma/tau subunit
MSYQVLARKWRPKNFDELVGQEHVSQALINGLDQDRLHHAFLFTGTRGVPASARRPAASAPAASTWTRAGSST